MDPNGALELQFHACLGSVAWPKQLQDAGGAPDSKLATQSRLGATWPSRIHARKMMFEIETAMNGPFPGAKRGASEAKSFTRSKTS